MNIPCINPCQTCSPFIGGASSPADPDYPFVNLSSEEPDVDNFIGRRFGLPLGNPNGGPPLGNLFYAIGCLGFCVSAVSQEDADLCAQRQEIECLSTNWPPQPPGAPDNPTPFNPGFPPTAIFQNTPQSCDFQCPDGQNFTFTTPAGTFFAFSQAAADLAAYSYACQKSIELRMCMGELSPTFACAGVEYLGTLSVSSGLLPVTFSIVGDLPEGIFQTQNQDTLFLSGVATTPGDYSFTVVATNPIGNTMQKLCEVTFFGIVTDPSLPEATEDVAYSVTLVTGGTVTGAVTFNLSGALPSGVTLNANTGQISGTPAAGSNGEYNFTVTALCDDPTISCSKEFFLIVGTSCSDESNSTFYGSSGLIATGANVVLPASEFRVGAPGDGYSEVQLVDGNPRVAVSTITWGEPQPSTVAVAPVPQLTGLSLEVQAGQGAMFPASALPLLATVYDGTPNPGTDEIVQVTNVVGDVLTIVRAQSGTSNSPIDVGWTIIPVANVLPWFVSATGDTNDGRAFTSYSSAYNTTSPKTIRIPVFPYGTEESIIFADSTSGASGAVMGPCSISTTYDCVGITELTDNIVWGAPTVVSAENGSASGSASGGSFNAAVSNPGGGLDEANVEIVGTFTCTGNGVAGRLTLTVSNFQLDSGNDWPRFSIVADSDLDGNSIWSCLQDNIPEWLTGNGVYTIPVVIACTPGAVITITVNLITVQGLGEQQTMTIAGAFSAW